MNGYRKSKGIVIELTALLDVIMIMLFWVMMNVQDNSDTAKAEAEQRAVTAELQLEDAQTELESLQAQLDENDQTLARVISKAESLDSEAAANMEALLGYEQGMLITLNIRYEDDGQLYIFNVNDKLGQAPISNSDEIAKAITQALNKAGLKKDDVILCAMIYDGSSSLYRDVRTVNSAVDSVRSVYNSFYCAYINTAR
ncbi:MAG: hypothetical protein IJK31_07710 [Ruminococcus sp.]|nr:hypothetical protein [Ruminococcus sp.]HRR76659.1 hypothetical protein [Ruminococcus sp.]